MSDLPGLRERKNARTREAIERAALELALEQGYDRTTVHQIAERANVSPRTVFTRYPNKGAIVFGGPEVLERVFGAALREGEGSILDRFLAVLSAEACSGDLARLRRLATLVDPSLRGELWVRLQPLEHMVATALADELDLPADDVGTRAFAGAVVAFLRALVDAAARSPRPEDVRAACRPGVDVLRAALGQLETRGRSG